MSAVHHHVPPAGATLRTAFVLSFAILGIELAGATIARSLALFSDAGHVLTDVFALGLAWFATAQAKRPADARNTYGYHRTGILVALVNAVTLIGIVLAIGYEAIARLRETPTPTVAPTAMFVSATVGIAINLYIGLGLHRTGEDNLNVRAATLHVFSDIAASVGVLVAAAVVAVTHWYAADAIVSVAIALLIAKGAWDLLRETVDILMESTPKDIDLERLVRDVLEVPGVSGVHDLHVWSIAGGVNALSAHVGIGDDRALRACDAVLAELSAFLASRYRITHSTIQFECTDCGPQSGVLYCSPTGDAADGSERRTRSR